MNRFLCLAALLLGLAGATDGAGAGAEEPAAPPRKTIIEDDFSGPRKFTDVSLVALWGGNKEPKSALTVAEKADPEGLKFQAVQMDEAAVPFSKWDQDLHCATAFDYPFAAIDRAATTVRVEFDAFWDEMEQGGKGWGENNRLTVVLMHAYPQGGPKLGDLERVAEGHPFGRPAYHFRIRNTVSSLGGMMNYGGGSEDKDGGFEKYKKDDKVWWLPGYLASNQKGASPGDEASYDGRKDPYPKTPTMKTSTVLGSAKQWRHFTWELKPERMTLFHRASKGKPEEDKAAFFMEIPRLPADPAGLDALRKRVSEAHGLTGDKEIKELPALYNWFPSVCALRFYLRGPKTHVARVLITTSDEPPKK